MAESIIQELTRCLHAMKARGVDHAWVSPENAAAFFRRPGVQAAAPPRPACGNAAPVPVACPPQQAPKPAAPVNAVSPVSAPARMPESAEPPRRLSVPTVRPKMADCPLTPLGDVSGLDWDGVKESALACKACRLYAERINMAFEDGCRQARLMFIGEGPGEEEDKQGVPFVGRAGMLLTRMIQAMGLDRGSQEADKGVYIANIVKCRPPQNRNPEQDEGNVCIAYLKRQIQLVSPKVIVLLGAVPLRFLLGKTGITAARGHWLEYEGIPVMPTFHPAYLLRFERQREKFVEEKLKVWSDLKQVMERLNLPLPQK